MIEAIPTQYAGVLFRSKSEAIYARALDLDRIAWVYEPQWLKGSDGYVPDFLVMPTAGDRSTASLLLFEYKPSRPSAAYMDRLGKYQIEITSKFPGAVDLFTCCFGSFYSDTPVINWVTFRKGKPGPEKRGLFSTAKLIEAKRYRFDLEDLPRAEGGY